MSKAIGMIEFKTTATGVTAADAMVKTSDVEIVEAQTVCPGKYISRQSTEPHRLRRSVRWEFLKHMMQLPLLRLQIRLQRLQL